mgnify:CR=1 FL=1
MVADGRCCRVLVWLGGGHAQRRAHRPILGVRGQGVNVMGSHSKDAHHKATRLVTASRSTAIVTLKSNPGLCERALARVSQRRLDELKLPPKTAAPSGANQPACIPNTQATAVQSPEPYQKPCPVECPHGRPAWHNYDGTDSRTSTKEHAHANPSQKIARDRPWTRPQRPP